MEDPNSVTEQHDASQDIDKTNKEEGNNEQAQTNEGSPNNDRDADIQETLPIPPLDQEEGEITNQDMPQESQEEETQKEQVLSSQKSNVENGTTENPEPELNGDQTQGETILQKESPSPAKRRSKLENPTPEKIIPSSENDTPLQIPVIEKAIKESGSKGKGSKSKKRTPMKTEIEATETEKGNEQSIDPPPVIEENKNGEEVVN